MSETKQQNSEVINKLLKPLEQKDETTWTGFLKTVDENILWYPTAWNDFHDLIFWFSGISGAKCPSLYIHTDCFPSNKIYEFITAGKRILDKLLEIDLIEQIELKPRVESFLPEIKYEYLPFDLAVIIASANNNEIVLQQLKNKNKEIYLSKSFLAMQKKLFSDYESIGKKPEAGLINKIFLLHISLPQYGHTKYLIYAFCDNIFFQRTFILEGGLKLSNIFNSNHGIYFNISK